MTIASMPSFSPGTNAAHDVRPMNGGILAQPSTSTFTSSRGNDTLTTLSLVSAFPPVAAAMRAVSSGPFGAGAGVALGAGVAGAAAAVLVAAGDAVGATAVEGGAAAGGVSP